MTIFAFVLFGLSGCCTPPDGVLPDETWGYERSPGYGVIMYVESGTARFDNGCGGATVDEAVVDQGHFDWSFEWLVRGGDPEPEGNYPEPATFSGDICGGSLIGVLAIGTNSQDLEMDRGNVPLLYERP